MRLPRRIVSKTLKIASRFSKNWPEDEWFSLDEDWDLNLYSYYDHGVLVCKGSIYPVSNSDTMTDQWENILTFVPEEGQYVN
jgi:hypothetical protein